MNSTELDALIIKAQKGECSAYEQNCLAFELVTYRNMSNRLERCVHDLIKEAEECR